MDKIKNNCEESSENYPFEIVNIDEKTNSQLLANFTGEKEQFIHVGPKKYFFPKKFEKYAAQFYNFKVRPDDVWVVTYPRSGTTWMAETAWLLANNLDYKGAEVPLTNRFLFFEYVILHHEAMIDKYYSINKDSKENCAVLDKILKPPFDYLDSMTGRRFIKTHLPLELLPRNLLTSGAKVIYVARNPKDVCVSYFHLYKMLINLGFNKDFAKFWYYFRNNLVIWSPYWSHIEEAWNKRDEKNLLFVFYEEMNKDLNKSLRKISEFLGANYSDSQLEILQNHLSFDNFKKNKAVNFDNMSKLGVVVGENQLIRKGKTGGSAEYFQGALKVEVEEWIQENLTATGIEFPV